MRMIGAGWGRTGTTSAAAALERLGCGPVAHMSQLFARPDLAQVWVDYREGRPVDLEALGASYGATVDWPGCWAWKDLAQLYPDAPVLLTVRDAEKWYDSVRGSIHLWANPHRKGPPPDAPPGPPPSAAAQRVVQLVWETEFGSWDAVLDKEATIAAYDAHVADIRATCPAGRLLEWQVTDGWEPLCAALGEPVPDEPFPHLNQRSERPPDVRDLIPKG